MVELLKKDGVEWKLFLSYSTALVALSLFYIELIDYAIQVGPDTNLFGSAATELS